MFALFSLAEDRNRAVLYGVVRLRRTHRWIAPSGRAPRRRTTL